MARRARLRAARPERPRTNRRAAQDKKFGPVADVVPENVQVIADWQLYRQKQQYSPELNSSTIVGQRLFFKWEVPNDRAWLVHAVTVNNAGPVQPGNVRLQIQIPFKDNSSFSSLIIGIMPMPVGSIGDDRVYNFVGNKIPFPFFAPEGPFYASSGSNIIVESLVPNVAGSLGVALLAYELPPTEDLDEFKPAIGFI